MSILKVDTIQEKTSGNGVEIAHALKGSGIAGHVIQVVQFTRLGNFQSSATGFVDVSSTTYSDLMSKAITTKAANSKILVAMRCTGYNGSNLVRGSSKIFRDSTLITADEYAWYAPQSTMVTHTISFLDEPSASAGTTITYKMQGNADIASIRYLYSDGGGSAINDITLMEIAQ